MYSIKHRTTRNVRCKDKEKNGTIAYITKKICVITRVLLLFCPKGTEKDHSKREMASQELRHNHSWPKMVMPQSEQALSRPSECYFLSKHNQSVLKKVMLQSKDDQSWPKLVMRQSEYNQSMPKMVMKQTQNNQSWPKMVIPQSKQALSRPSECYFQSQHNQSVHKKGMLRLKDDQSWPGLIILQLQLEITCSKAFLSRNDIVDIKTNTLSIKMPARPMTCGQNRNNPTIVI